ncbi:hypothetical protein MC885_016344 [Smutsia gigantea]|nr:hypothetical protein MC885_016344 [Smutsia gigantea]
MAGTALKRLMAEYKQLTLNPPEGIVAGPMNEEDFFEWEALIMGPEDTCFEFGVFPAILSFPLDYPLSPPKMRFTCEMFHPNIYPDGRVCISILHAPGDDPMGYESSAERWSPVQSVEKILLSVSPTMKVALTWTLPKCGGMTGSSSIGLPSRWYRSPWGSEAAPARVHKYHPVASSAASPGRLVTDTLCWHQKGQACRATASDNNSWVQFESIAGEAVMEAGRAVTTASPSRGPRTPTLSGFPSLPER